MVTTVQSYICPDCGGYVYRAGLLGPKPFKCVRCKRKFSMANINAAWFREYKKKSGGANQG